MTSVPLNPLMATDVIAYLIERAEPSLAIVDAVLWPKAAAAFAADGTRAGRHDRDRRWAGGRQRRLRAVLAGASESEPDVEIHGDDIWEIIFTSGTTAMPKGAMISHTYSYLGGYSFALTHSRGAQIECDLTLVSFLPLIFHIADQIMSFPAFLCGGTLVMGRSFDPAADRRRDAA